MHCLRRDSVRGQFTRVHGNPDQELIDHKGHKGHEGEQSKKRLAGVWHNSANTLGRFGSAPVNAEITASDLLGVGVGVGIGIDPLPSVSGCLLENRVATSPFEMTAWHLSSR
jgi:hypothetical protein